MSLQRWGNIDLLEIPSLQSLPNGRIITEVQKFARNKGSDDDTNGTDDGGKGDWKNKNRGHAWTEKGVGWQAKLFYYPLSFLEDFLLLRPFLSYEIRDPRTHVESLLSICLS